MQVDVMGVVRPVLQQQTASLTVEWIQCRVYGTADLQWPTEGPVNHASVQYSHSEVGVERTLVERAGAIHDRKTQTQATVQCAHEVLL